VARLVVRELEFVQRLKERAVEHGVSAEEEHRRILRQALTQPEEDFPDLKVLLQGIPDAGDAADFERIREFPRDVDLS